MRIKSFLALLGMGVMLAALVGCTGNETPVSSNITGSVTNAATGTTISGANVQLLQNGTAFGQPVTSTQSGYTFTNIPAGTYTFEVTGTGLTQTISGPFTFNGTSNTVNFPVYATGQVPGNPAPTPTTASVVVFGFDQNGNQIPVTAAFDASTATGDPAVLNGITPGAQTIQVGADGQTLTFTNVPFTANETKVIRAQFGAVGNSALTGTVTNANTGTALPNTSVQLLQNGTAVGLPTTSNQAGTYTFSNLQPGTYTVRVTGTGLAPTVVGPVNVTGTSTTLDVPLLTTGQLPSGTTPTVTTASIVAYGTDENGNNVPVTVTVNGTSATGNPAILNNITPASNQSITVTSNGQTQTFTNVTFTANEAQVIRAQFPTLASFNITGEVDVPTDPQNPSVVSPAVGAKVNLLQNGVVVATDTTNTGGQFTLAGATAGTYTIQVEAGDVVAGGNTVTITNTLSSPITVTNANISSVIITALTAAQVTAQAPTTAPTSTTGSLVAFVTDSSGNQIPATITVNGQSATGTATEVAVLNNITPGTSTISINANGVTTTVPNVAFTANNIIVLRQTAQ